MIIYSGLGWVVLPIWLCLLFGSSEIAKTYNLKSLPITFLASGVTSAILFWFGGRFLNNKNPIEIKEFHATEIKIVTKPRHTLFYVAIEYWGVIIGAGSLLLAAYLKLTT